MTRREKEILYSIWVCETIAHLGLTIDTHIQEHSYDFKERKIIYAVVHTEIEIENSLWNKITSASLSASFLCSLSFSFNFLFFCYYFTYFVWAWAQMCVYVLQNAVPRNRARAFVLSVSFVYSLGRPFICSRAHTRPNVHG